MSLVFMLWLCQGGCRAGRGVRLQAGVCGYGRRCCLSGGKGDLCVLYTRLTGLLLGWWQQHIHIRVSTAWLMIVTVDHRCTAGGSESLR